MTIEQIGINALAVLIPALVAIIIELIRRKLGLETIKKIAAELETKKELATLAVKMVEQIYKTADGDKKLKEATKWLSVQLETKGIKVDPEEIDGLLHSSLRKIKDELGEQWVTKA